MAQLKKKCKKAIKISDLDKLIRHYINTDMIYNTGKLNEIPSRNFFTFQVVNQFTIFCNLCPGS